jgi:hypothetical protein
MKEMCKNCKYWNRSEQTLMTLGIIEGEGHNVGECRRCPPTVYTTDKGRKSMGRLNSFPIVEQECWCGEFELRDWQNEVNHDGQAAAGQ